MQDSITTYIDLWRKEELQPFTGWDFSYLDGRMAEDPVPWAYTERATQLLSGAQSAIDLGTGGGEIFLRMRPSRPKRVVVTEEYPPNIALARKRLEPLGVEVFDVRLTETDPLPFADGAFDLILDRHAAFNSAEVARILAPDGSFLTQQVHGLWAQDLLAEFGCRPKWPDASPERYIPLLARAGLEITENNDWKGRLIFNDVGAIVYLLKATPWLVPDFSVDAHIETLIGLQERIETEEQLVFEAGKYLIEAKKPVKG